MPELRVGVGLIPLLVVNTQYKMLVSTVPYLFAKVLLFFSVIYTVSVGMERCKWCCPACIVGFHSIFSPGNWRALHHHAPC